MKSCVSFLAAYLLAAASLPAQEFRDVVCEGTYAHHLQGICVDDHSIYWSFTTTLVKTDLNGRVQQQIPVVSHHGDMCHHDGRLFVAVNLGKFNDPQGNAKNWIYVYDARTLKELARHEVPEVFHGAGGIGYREGHFFVVGGLPEGIQENYIYEYDGAFRFVKKHSVKSGQTVRGIQTATFAKGRWWFGCYGNVLLVADTDFNMLGRYKYNCSLGIVGLPDGRFLSATGKSEGERGCTGSARVVVDDEKLGLRP
jgi:hypothetical protein